MVRFFRLGGVMALVLAFVLAVQVRPVSASGHHRGTLVIQGAAAGTQVRVDGRPMGVLPLRPIALVPGSHLVVLKSAGNLAKHKIVIQPGAQTTLYAGSADSTITDLAALPLEPPQADPLELAALPLESAAPQSTSSPSTTTASLALGPRVVALKLAVSPEAMPSAFGPTSPLETSATVDAPAEWYTEWWVWTAAGVIVAGTGLMLYENAHRTPGGQPVDGVWRPGQNPTWNSLHQAF